MQTQHCNTFGGEANSANRAIKLLELTYGDTKNTNAEIRLSNDTINVGRVAVLLNFTGDSTSELQRGEDTFTSNWTISAQQLDSLGVTLGEDEIDEFYWGHFLAGTDTPVQVSLGRKDEDHRGKYGVVIQDPKSNGASDKVSFLVPADQVQANVVVKGLSGVGSSVSSSTGSALATYDLAPSGMLDTQVSTPSSYNLILVGGPAVNRLSAQFMGVSYPAYGAASGLSAGEAVLSLKDNGDKVALIVAGWEGTDTQRAAMVLKNYEAYKGKLMGAEVKVSGTTSSPTVVSA